MSFRGLSRILLELLFPKRCTWCGRLTGLGGGCCEERLAPLRLPNDPLPPAFGSGWLLADVWACFTYSEPVRGAILRMKFEDERNLALPLALLLAEKFGVCGIKELADVIVPAPLSPAAAKRRGYNQSALLAMELARHTGLPCFTGAILKIKETPPQHKLNREGRLLNLANAYAAGPQPVMGRRVLLVDDIITTGSTLNECARALKDAGASECRALCLAAAV